MQKELSATEQSRRDTHVYMCMCRFMSIFKKMNLMLPIVIAIEYMASATSASATTPPPTPQAQPIPSASLGRAVSLQRQFEAFDAFIGMIEVRCDACSRRLYEYQFYKFVKAFLLDDSVKNDFALFMSVYGDNIPNATLTAIEFIRKSPDEQNAEMQKKFNAVVATFDKFKSDYTDFCKHYNDLDKRWWALRCETYSQVRSMESEIKPSDMRSRDIVYQKTYEEFSLLERINTNIIQKQKIIISNYQRCLDRIELQLVSNVMMVGSSSLSSSPLSSSSSS